jgi:leucyl aminopeptidase
MTTHIHWTNQATDDAFDATVYFLSSQHPLHLPEQLPSVIRQAVQEMNARGQWSAKTGEVSVLPTYGLIAPLAVCFVGIGDGLRSSIQSAAAEVIKALAKRKLGRVLFSFSVSDEWTEVDTLEKMIDRLVALREGLELGHYRMESYAKETKPQFVFEALTVQIESQLFQSNEVKEEVDKRWNQSGIINRAVRRARDFVNMPGNLLVPEGLAQAAEHLAQRYPALQVEVLRENELKAKGMGALLAVGQGSAHPPRMIVLRYQGDPDSTQWSAVVGKGITFDTGGISLKTAKGMEEMIGDMGGAAATLGVMEAIAQLLPKRNVIGVIATAENMPSGTAYKPGDVITSYSKRTIEVLNTDAEGRVVLADAITYAKELGATEIVDLATLTGAILIAFGHEATGAVTNNQLLLDKIKSSSEHTGEPIWQLPVFQAYKEMLKSDVADVKNATGPHAGSITAGLFLGTFAEETPWVHLDIAGTSWLDRASGIHPKGGTGVMVRTLVHWLMKNLEAESGVE